jgi:Ca2+-binding EF-hand superfamily protein
MGCGDSKVNVDDDPNNDISKLQLSKKEVNAFRKAFQKMDKDHGGSINISEFIESLNVEITIVSEEVFEDMDTSNNGSISFKEFTLLTWRFCTRGLDSIAEFAFDIYDTDNSHELTKEEIKEMIIESYGKETQKHNVRRLVSTFTHSLTYSHTHFYSLTYSLIHSLPHSFPHSLPHSLPHYLTHCLTHNLTHYSLTH